MSGSAGFTASVSRRSWLWPMRSAILLNPCHSRQCAAVLGRSPEGRSHTTCCYSHSTCWTHSWVVSCQHEHIWKVRGCRRKSCASSCVGMMFESFPRYIRLRVWPLMTISTCSSPYLLAFLKVNIVRVSHEANELSLGVCCNSIVRI